MAAVVKNLMLRTSKGFQMCKRCDFSLSLCHWTTNRALYTLSSLLVFFIARIMWHSSIFVFDRISSEGTTANAFWANNRWIWSLMVS